MKRYMSTQYYNYSLLSFVCLSSALDYDTSLYGINPLPASPALLYIAGRISKTWYISLCLVTMSVVAHGESCTVKGKVETADACHVTTARCHGRENIGHRCSLSRTRELCNRNKLMIEVVFGYSNTKSDDKCCFVWVHLISMLTIATINQSLRSIQWSVKLYYK